MWYVLLLELALAIVKLELVHAACSMHVHVYLPNMLHIVFFLMFHIMLHLHVQAHYPAILPELMLHIGSRQLFTLYSLPSTKYHPHAHMPPAPEGSISPGLQLLSK
jgi:hypothetical protein